MAEPTVPRRPVVLDIGNERQLFDDYLIDGLENISRFVHRPVQIGHPLRSITSQAHRD